MNGYVTMYSNGVLVEREIFCLESFSRFCFSCFNESNRNPAFTSVLQVVFFKKNHWIDVVVYFYNIDVVSRGMLLAKFQGCFK